MPRVVIHAGLPKTATSFLQAQVFPLIDPSECLFNPERLTRMLIELSKEVQAGCTIGDERLTQLKEVVDQELDRITAPVVLISVEGLMPLHVGGYANSDRILGSLKELYPEADILVFLREQVSWFRSAYSFCLVSKYVIPFGDFVCRERDGKFGECKVSGLGVNVRDYQWDKVSGLVRKYYSSLRFFRFEDLLSDQRDLVLRDLARILGVEKLQVASSERVNQGLDEELMVTISKVAKWVPMRARWEPKYLYTRYSGIGGFDKLKYLYMRKSGQLILAVSKFIYLFARKKGSTLFTEKERHDLRAHYEQENDEFWAKNPMGRS